MLKILYVHGYLGHANGNASKLIKAELNRRNIECELDAPPIPILHPKLAVDYIRAIDRDYDVIVASSMGAFYAMQEFGRLKILVNPALTKTLVKTGDRFDDAILKEMQKMEDDFFNIFKDYESIIETYLVFGTRDTLADNKNFFINHYSKSQIYDVDMEHRMDKNGARKVVDIIENEILPISRSDDGHLTV